MKNLIRQFLIISQFLLLIPFASFSQSNWIELFNGKDLKGWEIKQGKVEFSIQNGVVTGTSTLFGTETRVGDRINIAVSGTNTYSAVISAITSNTVAAVSISPTTAIGRSIKKEGQRFTGVLPPLNHKDWLKFAVKFMIRKGMK
mgnify:CR=1 FL=1